MKALAAPWRLRSSRVSWSGGIYADIFSPDPLDPRCNGEYPLDFYQPGNEGQYVAYASLPTEGTIPTRHISGDAITVQTYDIGNSIDWFAEVLAGRPAGTSWLAPWRFWRPGHQELNTDAWRVVLAAAAGRD